MQTLQYQLDMTPDSRWEFVTAGSFAKQHLLYLQEAGLFDSGRRYFTQRSGLNSYLIKLTLSGQGLLEYGGEVYSLEPGTIFWIDCQSPQKYGTCPETGRWNVIWVHFTGATADAYYQAFLAANRGQPVARPAEGERVRELLRELLELSSTYLSVPDSDLRASALLTELLVACIRRGAASPDVLTAPPFVQEAVRYLSRHFADPITLERLAEQLSVSQYHLQRSFKASIGLSPAEYLSVLRINHAKELLRSSNLSVSEVALRVGMDPNYFIQLFRKNEHQTPGQYRRRWHGGPPDRSADGGIR